MGKKDASATKLPVDQYRKQIEEENHCSPRDMILSGKQDYKKTKSALKATRLKAEAKKNSSGFRDAFLVIAAILFFVLCVYAFFYLNLSTEINLDVDVD
ncbi:triple QxxK/R motif-containing protein isoform X1 [Thunnus albacares]|uniref:triple QxxK/R motif-containing protein isoform X1 n=1 Tax=Thunnus maccoyii TaxID=8240 RepID=UPI001C4A7963|nr:triple QxxK/R motif-containing protein isoform X1 [Thunnus maccoyii]XP_042292571.1 triple QxxK/R motif-containing protein isoform X1 [Thunnus maccoyii]XP_044192445.1 triple QxxK/R motif-containing protein isoform X1 [Thunnus albacares]